MTFDMTVQQTLQWKRFVTDSTSELIIASLHAYKPTANDR